MKKLKTSLALGAFATLLAASAPVATAQSDIENSTFTVTAPIEVGSHLLPAGTYFIKVVELAANRNTIQVMNVEQTKVFALVLTTPHPVRTNEISPTSRYIYYTTAAGQPKALRTWFARDTVNGQDIVYPKKRALELAAFANEPVIAISDTVMEAEYKTVPLTIVTPDQTVKPYEIATAPATAPPLAQSLPLKRLPVTASHVPLFAALGLLSVGGALALRTLARPTA